MFFTTSSVNSLKVFPLLPFKLCKIAALMNMGNHKHIKGFKEILSIRETLNEGAGRTRKYTEADVLKSILEKSSETIRQAPIKSEMI